jgi:hypothetical protein
MVLEVRGVRNITGTVATAINVVAVPEKKAVPAADSLRKPARRDSTTPRKPPLKPPAQPSK